MTVSSMKRREKRQMMRWGCHTTACVWVKGVQSCQGDSWGNINHVLSTQEGEEEADEENDPDYDPKVSSPYSLKYLVFWEKKSLSILAQKHFFSQSVLLPMICTFNCTAANNDIVAKNLNFIDSKDHVKKANSSIFCQCNIIEPGNNQCNKFLRFWLQVMTPLAGVMWCGCGCVMVSTRCLKFEIYM